MTPEPEGRSGSRAAGILRSVLLTLTAVPLMPVVFYAWVRYGPLDLGQATIPLIFCLPGGMLAAWGIVRRRWREVQGSLIGLAVMLLTILALMVLAGAAMSGTGLGTLAE